MRANSHHRPLLVAAVALQIGVATTAAVGPAQARPSSIGIDITACLGLALVKQTQFHLSQLRMSQVGHLHGLVYDDTCVLSYGILGVCIGILACRALSRITSPLHAMKSPSQIYSAAVNLGV
ncbi:hypothetical protein Tco_0051266 [Tanacetum coccineum]